MKTYKAKLAEGYDVKILVDSEGPVDPKDRTDPCRHLEMRDKWIRPDNARSTHCHLMVELLEAWFLADPESLSEYYGKNFKPSKLGNPTDVEAVAKSEVYSRFAQATKETTKGGYDKGRDTSSLVGNLSPEKLKGASYFAKRFLESF